MNIKKVFFTFLILLPVAACSSLTPVTSLPNNPTINDELFTATSPATEAPATAEPTELPAATQPAIAEEETTYGELARNHIETITEEIGARWSGTQEEADTAQYIADEFKRMGYAPTIKPFRRSGWDADGEAEYMFDSANVIAVKEGESAQVMVVGAHYDSVTDGLGADDNASGVGVLLELAERLADVPTPYTIHFIAFGAEEAGLLGSTDYIYTAKGDEIKNIVGFINFDSVIAGDMIYVYGNEGKPQLRDWALNWAGANGVELQTVRNIDLDDEDGYGTADIDAFEGARIPFAYFEATNWTLGYKDGYTQVDPQYGEDGAIIHTQYDTLEYIDKTFSGRVDEHLEKIIRVAYALLTEYK